MPARKKHTRLVSYAFLLVNALCWGAALITVKPAFDVTTPFRFLLYRFVLAGALSVPIVIYYWSKIKKPLQSFRYIVPLELLGTTIALSLLYFGLDRTSAIEASALATAAPVFVAFFGILILKERQEKHESIGLGLAVIGTLLLTMLPLLNGNEQVKGISIEGNALIIGQNIAIGLYYIFAKKYYRKLPKLFVTSISYYVGISTFLLLSIQEVGSLALLREAVTHDFQFTSVWIASFYMAIFGSIIGLTAYIKGQDGIEASEAALFTYLEPLVYIPLGVLVLKEQVHPLQLISLALIIAGIVIAERRKK